MTDANDPIHAGECFCGAVAIEAKGAPFAMGYCHCGDCRAWSAAPVNGFTLWRAGSVRVTRGEEHVAAYQKTERSHRTWCTRCGGHVVTDHPSQGFTDAYAAILTTLDFQPTLHVQYGESVLRIADGLPKYRDFPEEFGGTGETLPE
jgi:hypothetical protein